jgi:methyl-accepting chemotaxis protein
MRVLRKNYFVNPRLQLPIILGANVLALISVALILTLSAYSQAHLQNYMFSLNLPPDHPFSVLLTQREADYARMSLLIGIIQFALFNGTAIFLAHRIAGPLYRLERHLQEVGAGKEPKDVKFRKGDLYQPLAEACNKVLARLRETPIDRPTDSRAPGGRV